MACTALQMWTFSALVGAFLDLAIAYSLLCASTAAYFASKFLSVFGLSLPCSCGGLFGHPSKNSKCVQRVLVDSPLQKISAINTSIRSKAPFDLVSVSGKNSELNSHLGRKGIDEIPQDETLSTSCSGKSLEPSPRKYVDDVHLRISELCVSEGNAADNWKQRPGLQQRRRGSLRYRRSSSIPWQDSILCDSRHLSSPPISIDSDNEAPMKNSNDMQGDRHMEVSKDRETSQDINVQETICNDFGSNKNINNSGDTSEDVSTSEGSSRDGLIQINSSRSCMNDKDIIKALEISLLEERVAHANLCLELEKERNAAAIAADEAMAMILRIQEEKASIEMESRQFQRMVEEKSAFDVEEMNIMTEILLRRDREKYFLEKELESYRQIFFVNEQLDSDLEDTAATREEGDYSIHSSIKELELMPPKTRRSFSRRESISQDTGPPDIPEATGINYQNGPAIMSLNSPSPDEHDIHEKSMMQVKNEEQGTINTIMGEDFRSNSEHDFSIPRMSTDSSTIFMDNDRKVLCIKRSSSDTIACFQENSYSLPKHSPSRLRRKSMSSFDHERIKIDSEVGLLRERLKFVQKGRQRLNFSTTSLEGPKSQLKLLEDIACQIQKIRLLRNPMKAGRQASALPPLSKDTSKKRIL
ncbi:hypothetical protein SAY87_018417 [Trapa incisa]|uniref:GTD-binding domain-containing protein n=1 Tax=Trapa incisa TaxID=236973 RepID=A0AAN7L408_9MYRT|nr:hypothetical protein SAY87_018417 [Trapa incisa]